MLRGFLVLELGDGDERRVPVGASLVVGRTADCDLVVHDSAASRRHVEITAHDDGFSWKDLGSTNGTRVNGRRMLEGELKPGDVIEVGNTSLRLEVKPAPDTGPLGTPKPLFVETILDADGKATTMGPRPGKAAELLNAVYAVTNAIGSNYEPCSLVDLILEVTVKATHAQRGAVFFADARSEELVPCSVCDNIHLIEEGRLRHARPGEVQISQTVARRVLRGGESVLYQDTGKEAGLKDAQSIISLQLRSIACVPLRGKSGILGILYVDTDRSSRQYSHDDVLLLTAVGNSAGLALENAKMHQQLLEKQRIEQEIEYAWIIQEGFLFDDWPERASGYDVYGETRPAKTVGGDFYDFVEPGPDCVGILIGDVSGKGVPAALTMAQLLAAFRLHARASSSPAEVLKALNADLVVRSQRGTFCTLCYVTLDLATGKVTCANAGHMPGVRIGAQGAGLIGHPSGPPAGILAEVPWVDEELTLEPGDTLLLYTDGIVEARSIPRPRPAGRDDEPREYGMESLCRVAGARYGRSPREVIDAVNTDVRQYCAPGAPHDDCTMIALRYHGET